MAHDKTIASGYAAMVLHNRIMQTNNSYTKTGPGLQAWAARNSFSSWESEHTPQRVSASARTGVVESETAPFRSPVPLLHHLLVALRR
ncbi:hypothetical protein F2Q70_00013433 [Brassica cretica]|uniref:Uncharacterized protein n=1 Tax=Brassica cretica TaxID=69181 RepID=A0A8S9M1X4_BRACR|nr:hypothetical protein F2Q70_00013433 [Brassica cretica]